MMLLGIDTATNRASIALDDGICVHSEHSWCTSNNHTVELSEYVERMITSSEINVELIKAIAVAIGPGSFTGLRIGLGFAKGLALAYSIPLIGVPTMDILAYMQPKYNGYLLTIIEAGRQRIVVGKYHWDTNEWMVNKEPYLTTWQELQQETESGNYYICGEVDPEYLVQFGDNVVVASSALNVRRAASLVTIARNKMHAGEVDDSNSLSPYYLRPIPNNDE